MNYKEGREIDFKTDAVAAKMDTEDGMPTGRTEVRRRWRMAIVAAGLVAMTGCGNFFVPVNNGGGTPGTTGNSVYVANRTTNSLAGFSIGTATLSRITNLPMALGFSPLSMAINPLNTLLYVGGVSGIHVFIINSDGSLTSPTANPIPAIAYAASMTISPDGQWLIVLDGISQQLDIFQINASTGNLTSVTGSPAIYSIKSGTWTPTSVTISPNGGLIFAALGTAGDAEFTFNTTSGLAVFNANLNMPTATTSDFQVAVDNLSANIYIARSGTQGGVAVYSIGSGGVLNSVAGSPFAAGQGTYAITLDKTGTYVYAANRGDSTISGYTIGTGPTLTPLKGSPYASGTGVQSIGRDSTGKYLLAAALGGSPDLTMYSFDITVPGMLDPATSVATDTDPAGATAVALTH